MARLKIVLNDANKLRELLQETYYLADEQLIQAQNEINKLSNATQLQDEIMENKGKYAKAINDYMNIKDKAIAKKMDIAKLMSEILKYNGNVEHAMNSESAQATSIDFSKIREMIEENTSNKGEKLHLKR